MQVLASQFPFMVNRNAELALPPLFWPGNCIKIGGACCTAEWPYCLSPILCLRLENMLKRFVNWSHIGFN